MKFPLVYNLAADDELCLNLDQIKIFFFFELIHENLIILAYSLYFYQEINYSYYFILR